MASGRGCPGAPPYPGRPELVVLGRPEADWGEKPGFNSPPRGGRVYTANRLGTYNGNPGFIQVSLNKS